MELPRRHFLRVAAAAIGVAMEPRIASALDYPTRSVRIVVPVPPGLAPDIIARLIGQSLSERMS